VNSSVCVLRRGTSRLYQQGAAASIPGHGYFAATVGKAIGAALGGSSAVQAVTTDPAGSLDARQILLVDQLLAMLAKIRAPGSTSWATARGASTRSS
jgi:hypothetical protein